MRKRGEKKGKEKKRKKKGGRNNEAIQSCGGNQPSRQPAAAGEARFWS